MRKHPTHGRKRDHGKSHTRGRFGDPAAPGDPCRDVNVTPALFNGEHIRREVFTTDAFAIAECIDTKRSNLRNGYNILVRLRMDMQRDPNNTARLEEGLGKLERWAQYQASRKTAPVGPFTKRFIVKNCERTRSKNDLEGFYQLFQSVLAYISRD